MLDVVGHPAECGLELLNALFVGHAVSIRIDRLMSRGIVLLMQLERVIYAIENPVGDVYFGQTARLSDRIREHFSSTKNRALKESINTFGVEWHSVYVVKSLPAGIENVEVDAEEASYITAAWSMGIRTMNVRPGGSTSTIDEESRNRLIGVPRPESVRRKISEAKRGRRLTQLHRKRLSESRVGKPRSASVRKMLIQLNKSRVWTAESRAKLALKATGRPVSNETRKLLSLQRTGVRKTEEVRNKLAALNRSRVLSLESQERKRRKLIGFTPSRETRMKMSLARRMNHLERLVLEMVSEIAP